MKLTRLSLNNFRNYDHCDFEFNNNLNIIIGDNGSGKTTLLEAIHYLSITKSFRTHNDDDVINNNHIYYQIFGTFKDNNNNDSIVNLNYSKNDGKKLFVNNTEFKKKTDIIGKIPVIILSPGIRSITEGGPSVRRNFIDRILSQTDHDFLKALIEYRRMLNQRNAILADYKNRDVKKYNRYIETIDEIMISHALYIQINRQKFVDYYNPIFEKIYRKLAHFDNPVYVKLNPNISTDTDDFSDVYKNKLIDRYERDLILGRTGAGPHLDQVQMIFGDRDIRFTGSQGEHKIYLIALKIAESLFIEERLKNKVIFLLDDLFALLDIEHCINVIGKIGKSNQIFITATDITVFKKYKFRFDKYNMKIFNLPIGVS